MRSRDVVGKRIVSVWNEVVAPQDRDYYGPRVVCTQITLDDGTRLVAHAYESSDQPVSEHISGHCGAPDVGKWVPVERDDRDHFAVFQSNGYWEAKEQARRACAL